VDKPQLNQCWLQLMFALFWVP